MPEGLEQGITPEQMSDLISFLKKPPPRMFGGATREQIAAARRSFAAEQPNGFAKLIEVSEYLDYPSWLGRLPLLHCRPWDGKARVTWQSARPKESNGDCVFTLPVAMGLLSQPPGKFTLKVNGKAALEFDVTLEDSRWQSADGRVRMSYHVMETNTEDSNGVLTIVLAHEGTQQAEPPVTFEVVGSRSYSQRWFGIYDINAMTATASR